MQLKTGEWPLHYTNGYFISLGLLAASLPLSKFTMSLFQFSTLFFWLWHGVDTTFLKKYPIRNLVNPLQLTRFIGGVVKNVFTALIRKFLIFFRNKPAMAIFSLMILHVIGLIYTTDFEYALKDLRTKLPLFILPLFIATGPRISNRTFYWILAVFIAAVVGGSIYRLIQFIALPVADSRAIEVHTSHIRYSLNAVYAVFIALFFVQSATLINVKLKVLLVLIAVWLVAFMTYMNYSTGILIFTFVSFLLLVFLTLKIKNGLLKKTILVGIGALIILPLIYVFSIGYKYLNTPPVEFSKLEKFTSRGNSYYHDTLNFKLKNGKWTGLYISDKEMRETWAKRSTVSLDNYNQNKQLNRYTLIRYLASKDLRKDADGVNQLTEADVHNIEQGIDRYDYKSLPGLRTQIEDFIISYQRYVNVHDPNSSSMVQRFEYWRTSLLIIRQNPLIGVGTGDIPQAFEDEYNKINTNLAVQYQLRSHNQYLSITVAFGIIGLIWFLFTMFYPGITTGNFRNYFYVVFWIIFMISMLTEDTIESQEGVTFYVLFAALMLLGRDGDKSTETLLN